MLLNRVWFWGALKKAGFSPAIGDSVADQPWFINLRATYRFVVSRVQRDANRLGHSTVLIATPIRLAGGNTGALAARVGLGRFGAMPATLELPDGAVAYLADAGTFAAALDRALLRSNAAMRVIEHDAGEGEE